MKREQLHRKITELEASEDLKEVLRAMIVFIDEEDEVVHGKFKQDIEKLKSWIGSIEDKRR